MLINELYSSNISSGFSSKISIEVLNWSIIASSKYPSLKINSLNKTGNINNSCLKGYRKVYFRENKKYLNTPVYDRYNLSYSTVIKGPAIIEEHESTTVIGPKSILKVDSSLNLNIKIK